MTAGELATARRLGLCVPIIVLNDGWLGLMKIKQERQGNPESASVLGEPMEPPAHYFGVPVRAVRNQAELADAIRWGLSLDGPSVIETFVDVEPYSKTVFD
jgi:thiamine pyrophosphate-dependent acetolactate synthase large subunit-like protein